MWLLDKFDATFRSILLHSYDEHLSFLSSILNFFLCFTNLLLLLVLLSFLLLNSCFHTLLDSNIKWNLTVFIQHEKMVREICELSLKLAPVVFILHQLVDSVIAILV